MKKLFVGLLACALLFLLSSCGSSGSYEGGFADGYEAGFQAGMNAVAPVVTVPQAAEPSAENTDKTLIRHPEPENGHLFDDTLLAEGGVPLTIETSGSGGYYFVIDPVSFPSDSYPGHTMAELRAKYFFLRVYARAGSTINVTLPVGEYEIYYAHGTSWYGEDDLFGPDTAYYKCDDVFLFEETSEGFAGWTLTLEPTANGNLDTDVIGIDDFPVKYTEEE